MLIDAVKLYFLIVLFLFVCIVINNLVCRACRNKCVIHMKKSIGEISSVGQYE